MSDESWNALSDRFKHSFNIDFPNILDLNIGLLGLTVEVRTNISYFPKGFGRRIHVAYL